ncbi:FAD:protein FMN transferase [Enterococcus faecalis]
MQQSQTIYLMGTVIDVFVDHEEPEKILEEVHQRLITYEQRFSANDSTSELMAVNQQAGQKPVSVHPELYQLIALGKKHSCDPASHLNVTIGPLVQTWRIGFKDARVPSEEEIKACLKKINPEKIHLNPLKQTVFLEEEGMKLDLGALAKGYIADLLIAYLKEVNVTSALINLGGNIVTLGPSMHQNKKWRIGIRNPQESRETISLLVEVANQSVVTSGIYERSLTEAGRVYHHLLDPTTGYPLETEMASITIISDASVDGEIWTTRLFGYPIPEALEILNQLDGIEGVIITQDQQILYSSGLADTLHIIHS